MNLFRNLFGVYRRYALATWLNVLGLTLAFTGFYIAVKQVWFEVSYDRCYPDYEQIYRLEHISSTGFSTNFVLPMLEQLYRDAPNIEKGGIERFTTICTVTLPDRPESPERLSQAQINREYTELFGFHFIEGAATGFERQDKAVVILPASMACRWFGTEAVGKQIVLDRELFTVTGVYADFPRNASVKNKIYRPLVDPLSQMEDMWGNANYTAFIKVRSGADPESIVSNIVYPEGFMKGWEFMLGKEAKARLFPITDLYFHSQKNREGNLWSTSLFLGVTALILLVSVINFINFSMSLAPTRIRGVNTQKVMGASVFSLRAAIVGEAVFLSMVSFILSLVVVQLISYTSFADLLFFDLSLSYLPSVMGLVAVWAVLLGVFAGLPPALYITSVPVALALKGSFVLSYRGLRLRNLLIGFQFFFAFVLIVQTMFIYEQNRYMLQTPLGFNKERIVTVNLYSYISYNDWNSPLVERFFERLRTYAGTERIFTSSALLLNPEDLYEEHSHGDVGMQILRVDSLFTETLGIPVVEGRPFTAADQGNLLVTLSGKTKYNLKLGDKTLGYEGVIVGFIPDIKLRSFRQESGPLALVSLPRNYVVYIKLKEGADEQEAVSYIRGLVKQIGAETSLVPVRMLDNMAAERYESERKESQVMGVFCLVCLVITIMGIFGLVIFESQMRRKEVGLRKISGATIGSIVLLFNRRILFIVSGSFLLSLLPAYYFATRWLNGFVYRIPVYWWVFALSLLVVSVITTIVVTMQCWRIATSNPVDSLRNE